MMIYNVVSDKLLCMSYGQVILSVNMFLILVSVSLCSRTFSHIQYINVCHNG